MAEREAMEFDVVDRRRRAVGPRRRDPPEAARRPRPTVCVVEKGSEVGAHILSGAVFEPRALDELIPDWRDAGRAARHAGGRRPLPVADRDARASGCRRRRRCTTTATTSISLGNLCRWLGSRPRRWGSRSIRASPPPRCWTRTGASRRRHRRHGRSAGTASRRTELPAGDRAARRRDAVRRGLPRLADQAADGSGSACATGVDPQTYAHRHQGAVGDRRPSGTGRGWSCTRSAGRSTAAPMAARSSITRREPSVSLRVRHRARLPQPVADPVRGDAALQDASRRSARHFEGGRRIAYGARALNEGGLQSIPRLDFPGRRADRRRRRVPQRAEDQGQPHRDEVGDAGGRGGGRGAGGGRPASWPGIPSGCGRAGCGTSCAGCATSGRPSRRSACGRGLAYSALDTYVLRGNAPWTLHHPTPTTRRCCRRRSGAADRLSAARTAELTFDRLSSVFISNTNHEENQPAHLRLRDPAKAITVN